jgi:hypothetical protein
VLDFAVCVIIPSGSASLSNKRRRKQNLALSDVLLRAKLYFKLRKLWHIHDASQDSSYSFKSISGVTNLVLLEVFHLSGVRGEILR